MINTSVLNDIFLDCLLNNDEVVGDESDQKPKDGVPVKMVKGVAAKTYTFNIKRLEGHRETIKGMLEELSPNFKKGWSFLKIPCDKDNVQWGEHQNAEQLMCLGIALGYVRYCLPRQLWQILPGAMPYISINTEGKK